MKKVMFAVLLLLPPLLSGCWDHYELNEVSIVTGMAIDKGEKQNYRLSVEVVNPNELAPKKSSGNAASIVYSMEGDSVAELSHKMNVGVSRRLVFSHMQTLVISEEVAKRGMLDFLEFMERNREIRDDFNVVLAKRVGASDILSVNYAFQKVSTLKLHTQLTTAYREWGGDTDVRLKDIIAALTSEGRQPVAAVVTIRGNPKKGNSVDNNKKIKPDALVELTNMGVFKGEKLIGYMSLDDTRSYLWTQDKLRDTTIVVKDPKKNEVIASRMYRNKAKIRVTYVRGKPRIQVFLTVEGRIDGTDLVTQLDKKEVFSKIESMMAKKIEDQVGWSIRKTQKMYGVDIYGFGEDLKRQDYTDFVKVAGKWDQEFTRADIEVKATVKLRNAGLRSKSFLDDLK